MSSFLEAYASRGYQKKMRDRIVRSFLVGMISFYQGVISPMIPRCCRFYPSCSAYAKEAIRQWGLWRGGWLSVRRLIRCHPFNAG